MLIYEAGVEKNNENCLQYRTICISLSLFQKLRTKIKLCFKHGILFCMLNDSSLLYFPHKNWGLTQAEKQKKRRKERNNLFIKKITMNSVKMSEFQSLFSFLMFCFKLLIKNSLLLFYYFEMLPKCKQNMQVFVWNIFTYSRVIFSDGTVHPLEIL